MSPKRAAALQIILALIVAAAMIASKAYFGEDAIDEHIVIALWWIPFSMLTIGGIRRCTCVRTQE